MTSQTADDTFEQLEAELRAALRAVIPHLLDNGPDAHPAREADSTAAVSVIGHGGRSSRRVVSIAAALIALAGTVAVVAVLGRPDPDPPGTTNPPTPTPTSLPSVSLPCDDYGCHGFDDLPVVQGASDYYIGPADLGEPQVDLALFDNLTRCAALDATNTRCAKLEGIAAVSLVTYPPSGDITVDTSDRPTSSFNINIGTTFTEITPDQYAATWGTTGQGTATTSPTTVRGHQAIRSTSGTGSEIVWQERPGVLVWVTTPSGQSDRLIAIAEGVRSTPGPSSIPDRVVIPFIGESWQAQNNDGDGGIIARAQGRECFALRHVNACGQTIDGRTFIEPSDTGTFVAGSTPSDISTVRVTAGDGTTQTQPTQTFATYSSHFFHLIVDWPSIRSIEWLDASNRVIATETPAGETPQGVNKTPPTTGTIEPQVHATSLPALGDSTSDLDTVLDSVRQRVDTLQQQLGPLGYTITSTDTHPGTGTTAVTAADQGSSRTIDLTITPGTPLLPENHTNRPPLVILEQTDTILHGEYDSSDGWRFEITLTRTTPSDPPLPTADIVQQLLYDIDP